MKVAVAVIMDAQRRMLITQRPHHVPHGGFWEFPGGKVELHETPEDALAREIKEEIGIDVIQCDYLGDIHHQYADKDVQLIVFKVSEFSGVPRCLEGQLNMKWIDKSQINPAEFPEANQRIFSLL